MHNRASTLCSIHPSIHSSAPKYWKLCLNVNKELASMKCGEHMHSVCVRILLERCKLNVQGRGPVCCTHSKYAPFGAEDVQSNAKKHQGLQLYECNKMNYMGKQVVISSCT